MLLIELTTLNFVSVLGFKVMEVGDIIKVN